VRARITVGGGSCEVLVLVLVFVLVLHGTDADARKYGNITDA
jgi:hypothetical protein